MTPVYSMYVHAKGVMLDEILVGNLAGLDDEALEGIIDSSNAQSAYLGRFPADREALALSAVCGVIAVAAETALVQKRTGITL
jgi:hypothetical protein